MNRSLNRVPRIAGGWLLALATVGLSPGRSEVPVPCDAPDAPRWVVQLRDRMTGRDGLVRYAIERHGPPRTCDGSVTAEFDGMEFGELRLGFADGVTFEVETLPPESSIVTLRVPGGFGDEAAARLLLQTYTARVGVDIDWGAAMVTMVDGERIHTFQDPDDGLNATGSLIFRGDRLVGLRFSLAL